MTAFEILCKILASEIMGKNNLAEVEKELNESNAEELYSIAKTFDMAHLCGSAFKKMSLDISEEILAPFYNEFTHRKQHRQNNKRNRPHKAGDPYSRLDSNHVQRQRILFPWKRDSGQGKRYDTYKQGKERQYLNHYGRSRK